MQIVDLWCISHCVFCWGLLRSAAGLFLDSCVLSVPWLTMFSLSVVSGWQGPYWSTRALRAVQPDSCIQIHASYWLHSKFDEDLHIAVWVTSVLIPSHTYTRFVSFLGFKVTLNQGMLKFFHFDLLHFIVNRFTYIFNLSSNLITVKLTDSSGIQILPLYTQLF